MKWLRSKKEYGEGSIVKFSLPDDGWAVGKVGDKKFEALVIQSSNEKMINKVVDAKDSDVIEILDNVGGKITDV